MGSIAFQPDAFQNDAFQVQDLNVLVLSGSISDAIDAIVGTLTIGATPDIVFAGATNDGNDTVESVGGIRILLEGAGIVDAEDAMLGNFTVFDLASLISVAVTRDVLVETGVDRRVIVG